MFGRSLVSLAACVTLTVSCQHADAPTSPGLPRVPPSLGANGTVEYLHVEGGCWAIDVSGKTYLPHNLPEQYRIDGQPVRVVFYETPNMGSVCMVGPVVTLVAIQKR